MVPKMKCSFDVSSLSNISPKMYFGRQQKVTFKYNKNEKSLNLDHSKLMVPASEKTA